MKLTAKLAELRIDIGDRAIDDHYVAGVGRGTARRAPRRRSSNNCVYDGSILAPPVGTQKTALRPHPFAWIESQGPNGARAFGTGRVVITQLSSGYLSRDFDNPVVKVPYRAIIDALRFGHTPIRNHLIKSIDQTPT